MLQALKDNPRLDTVVLCLDHDPAGIEACGRLADAGIVLGNQMVLLNGINNDKYIVRLLNQRLLKIRVRPYYMFHPKRVKGTGHFYVSIEEGLDILDSLRGNTSGLAIPAYIYSAEGGYGKIPLLSEYKVSRKGNEYVFRTWEGREVRVKDE